MVLRTGANFIWPVVPLQVCPAKATMIINWLIGITQD